MKRVHALAVLMIIALTAVASGQVPRTISYQGVLTDAAGTFIADGNHTLLMSLYDNASASTPIYTETQTVVVVKGLFNAIIGSVTPIPVLVSFDRGYFLGVTVDGGTELVPRTPLSAVPYALRAAAADVADALAPSATGIVRSVNGQQGTLTLQGGGGTTITNSGTAFTISSTGGGGTGIQGVQSTDGSLSITNPNGPTANLGIAPNQVVKSVTVGATTLRDAVTLTAGSGITLTPAGNAVTIAASGGSTGIQTLQTGNAALDITNPAGPTTTVTVKDGGIGTAQLANAAVTLQKLSSAGATSGQHLAFNGTNLVWVTPAAGGVQTVQSTNNTLDVSNGGGPTATVNVKDGGIGTTQLANGAVTTAKLSSAGASSGQVLSFDGSGVVWSAPGGGGGLTFPYTSTAGTSPDMFALTNTGSGRTGYFLNTNTTTIASTLYGETASAAASNGVEGVSAHGHGVRGRGNAQGSGVFGSTVTIPAGGSTFSIGSGVSGFSDAAYGTAGVSYSPSHAGLYGMGSSGADGVRGSSSGGTAGVFEITNNANANHAIEGTTPGTGAGVRGLNTATAGVTNGVLGETTSGSPNAAGVLGRVVPVAAGSFSAGVRGENNGNSGTGVGVYGSQNGSGYGVYGTTPNGIGVVGETGGTSGAGVRAAFTGGGNGTALEIVNGAIKLTGSSKAAFVHTASSGNAYATNGTQIDNAMCDGDANAILIVTQRLGTGSIYNPNPIGVYYTGSKWAIINEINTAIPVGAQFNVLVIKQ
ncbi:MAG: hypothetical protein IPP94_10940 [Ignavibacteria bacterium]|nr:hypothetical protein [Ignavibacteria bacterium]